MIDINEIKEKIIKKIIDNNKSDLNMKDSDLCQERNEVVILLKKKVDEDIIYSLQLIKTEKDSGDANNKGDRLVDIQLMDWLGVEKRKESLDNISVN